MFKRILYILGAVSLLAACTQFDDSSLKEQLQSQSKTLQSLKDRIAAAEAVQKAYDAHLFITGVTTVAGGYVLSFSDGSSTTIANGSDGQSGSGETLIQNIKVGESSVQFFFTDGTTLEIPLYDALSIEFDSDDLLVMQAGDAKKVGYTVTSNLGDVNVEVVASSDLKAWVTPSGGKKGSIFVQANGTVDEFSKVTVLAANGKKVIVRTLTFENAQIRVKTGTDVNVPIDGGTVDLVYLANMDFDVYIPAGVDWIFQTGTKALTTRTAKVQVSKNEGMPRSAVVSVGDPQALHIDFTINQASSLDPAEIQALTDLYNSTRGKNWKRNDNWCSDKPLGEWYGLSVNDKGQVIGIDLNDNGLNGTIPESICNLSKLQYLYLGENSLTGSIPSQIGNLKELEALGLYSNHLSGDFPESITSISTLKYLYLQYNYGITGNLPESIGNLKDLVHFRLDDNEMSGPLPVNLGKLTKLDLLDLSANKFTGNIPDSYANLTKVSSLYIENNQLTGTIPEWIGNLKLLTGLALSGNRFTGTIPESIGKLDQLMVLGLQNNPGLSGDIPESLGNLKNVWWFCLHNSNLSGPIPESLGNLESVLTFVLSSNNLTGRIPESFSKLSNLYDFYLSDNNITGNLPDFLAELPDLVVLQTYGNRMKGEISETILDSKHWTSDWDQDQILPQQPGYGLTATMYESTDFSKDGEVKTLQTHSVGNGIQLIITGDAFVDKDIKSGKFDAAAKEAMEDFFAVEPYASFRDMFDVYSVTAVSKNNILSGETALETTFGKDTYIGGDLAKAVAYARKAVDNLDEALILALVNKNKYAGTCHFFPYSGSDDFGNGLAVAFCTMEADKASRRATLNHEAGGHGFAKLEDEYGYSDNGAIPAREIESHILASKNGWWKNVDFTSDPKRVKWAKYLEDSRYRYDGLGVYEGGCTYWSGVWRPTENSIMRYNTGGFNAPSREAIWYRLHKLAYGSGWTYNHEEFVEYDARNRKTSASAPRRNYVELIDEPQEPLARPVMVDISWRDLLESAENTNHRQEKITKDNNNHEENFNVTPRVDRSTGGELHVR